MAQLKSTTVSGNLSVSGNFLKNTTYSGTLTSNSNFTVKIYLTKVGSLVTGSIDWRTISTATLESWKWTAICPAGALPAAFRPTEVFQTCSTQYGGGASLNINTDGSISVNSWFALKGSYLGGCTLAYFTN